MKKLFCAIFIVLFLLSAVSCGGSKETTAAPQKESNVPIETTATEDTTEVLLTETQAETTLHPEETTVAESLSPGTAANYLAIVNELKAKYGEGRVADEGYYLRGLAFVRLIDFDGDGEEELVCAFENPEPPETSEDEYDNWRSGGAFRFLEMGYEIVNQYAVYGKGSAEPIVGPRGVSVLENGGAPGICFIRLGDIVYLEDTYCSTDIVFSHLENGRFVQDLSYFLAYNENIEYINGEEVDHDAAWAALERFHSQETWDITYFSFHQDQIEKGEMQKVLDETVAVEARLAAAANAE